MTEREEVKAVDEEVFYNKQYGGRNTHDGYRRGGGWNSNGGKKDNYVPYQKFQDRNNLAEEVNFHGVEETE